MDEIAERLKARTNRFPCAVFEESDESQLWLEVSNDRKMGDAKLRPALLDESGQLLAMFSKACVTARSRERSKK